MVTYKVSWGSISCLSKKTLPEAEWRSEKKVTLLQKPRYDAQEALERPVNQPSHQGKVRATSGDRAQKSQEHRLPLPCPTKAIRETALTTIPLLMRTKYGKPRNYTLKELQNKYFKRIGFWLQMNNTQHTPLFAHIQQRRRLVSDLDGTGES